MEATKCKVCGHRHYGTCAQRWTKTETPKALPPHHLAWLAEHPDRSVDWLSDRLMDGFHIHHIDGNDKNNDPSNLILIEKRDHARKIMPVLRNHDGPPFDRNAYQREYMRKRRAEARAKKPSTP